MNKTRTRTICCKLDVEGHDAVLAATQRAFNTAASWIARVCWDEGIPNTNTAHHRVYGETRERFGVGAPLAVCARAKAVEAIKAVKAKRRETCPPFGPRGSMRYDARTYRLMRLDRVSLTPLEGRVVCRLLLGAGQHETLVDPAWEMGGADLVWRQGGYYLHLYLRLTQSREAPPDQAPVRVERALGVDLGIVNLATASDGQTFSGARVHRVRARSHLRRQRLQKVNTKNAKRRLRQNAGRERRFQREVNPCSSKTVVQKAVVARTALALEDLRGIREPVTVRRAHRAQRYERHSWACFQLRTFLTYKAAWAGVPVRLAPVRLAPVRLAPVRLAPVRLVDPRNTRRAGAACGHCEKANRKAQSEFLYLRCGFTLNADHNAAIHILRSTSCDPHLAIHISRKQRAVVTQPLASPLAGEMQAPAFRRGGID